MDDPTESDTNIKASNFSNDQGEWDITSKEFVEYWTEKGPHECHNLNADFSLTKREYHKENRYLTKSYFEYMKPNKQIGKREWLVYSPKTKKVYCFYCLLFCDYEQTDW